MCMSAKIVLQGLVTVRNDRILIETVQAMKQCFFERDVSATESLYIIQATGFQSVFERCKIFRFFPNPYMPQEEQLKRETVGFTCCTFAWKNPAGREYQKRDKGKNKIRYNSGIKGKAR